MDKFWMVYVEGNRTPEYKHATVRDAVGEASRLAQMYPGKRVFVLATIGYAHAEKPVVKWTEQPIEAEDIPF